MSNKACGCGFILPDGHTGDACPECGENLPPPAKPVPRRKKFYGFVLTDGMHVSLLPETQARAEALYRELVEVELDVVRIRSLPAPDRAALGYHGLVSLADRMSELGVKRKLVDFHAECSREMTAVIRKLGGVSGDDDPDGKFDPANLGMPGEPEEF